MASIIKNKEDRSLAVEAAIKSVGGNMLGFYGMLGQKHDAMVIAEFPSKIEYMALIAKVMAAGATTKRGGKGYGRALENYADLAGPPGLGELRAWPLGRSSWGPSHAYFCFWVA